MTDGTGHPTAKEALNTVRRCSEDLVADRVKPYDAGREMWGEAMGGAIEDGIDGEHCQALWLLWGALIDWVAAKPDETTQAERAMRRAAGEWLEVRLDPRLWRPFFERWLYEELGYERPSPSSPS